MLGGAQGLVFLSEKGAGHGSSDPVDLVALDATTGRERWRTASLKQTPSNVVSLLGAQDQIGLFEQFRAVGDTTHTAVDLCTGRQLWSSGNFIKNDVALLGDTVRTKVDGTFRVLDLRTGRELSSGHKTGAPGFEWGVPNVLLAG